MQKFIAAIFLFPRKKIDAKKVLFYERFILATVLAFKCSFQTFAILFYEQKVNTPGLLILNFHYSMGEKRNRKVLFSIRVEQEREKERAFLPRFSLFRFRVSIVRSPSGGNDRNTAT